MDFVVWSYRQINKAWKTGMDHMCQQGYFHCCYEWNLWHWEGILSWPSLSLCLYTFKSLCWICYGVASVLRFCFLATRHVASYLALQPGIKPTPPILEGEVLTTGPLAKSLCTFMVHKVDYDLTTTWVNDLHKSGEKTGSIGCFLRLLYFHLGSWKVNMLDLCIKAKGFLIMIWHEIFFETCLWL